MVDPWNGASLDKIRHPRLGRFVDNIWILSLNRIIGAVAPTLIVAILGWGVVKFNSFNDVAKDFPSLVSTVQDIAKQVRDESAAQDHIIDHVKSAEKDIGALKSALVDDQRAIAQTQSDAAAAKVRVDDIKEDLKRIEALVTQNLAISQAHSEDIRATRNAVAPRPRTPPY